MAFATKLLVRINTIREKESGWLIGDEKYE